MSTRTVTLKYLLLAEDKASKTLKGTSDELDDTGKKAKGLSDSTKLAMVAAGAAVVGFAVSSVNKFKSVTLEARGVQRAMGGTLEQASRFREEAVLSGVDAGSFTKSMQKLDKTLVTAGKSTTSTADITRKLGFSFKDAHGKVLPMTELLPKISDRFASMPDGAGKTALAMQLFGKAGNSMLPMLDKGSAGLKDLGEQSDQLGTTLDKGAIDKVAEAREQSRLFTAGLDGLKVQVGAQLLPILNKLFGFIESYIIPVFKAVSGFVQDHQGLFATLAIAIGTMVAAWKIWNIALAVWTAILDANPIGLIVIAIAALVAALVVAWKHSKTFRDIVHGVFHAIATVANWLWDHVLHPLFKAWKLQFDLLLTAYRVLRDGIRTVSNVIADIFGFVKQHWGLMFFALTGGMSLLIQHWRDVRDVFRAVWDGIKTVFGNVVGFVTGMPAKIARAAKGMWDGIADAFKSAVNWILGAWNAIEFKIPGFHISIPLAPDIDFAGFTLGLPDIPLLARGGPVQTGRAYIVGEHRPELFVPNQTGTILPRVPGAAAAGDVNLYVTVQGSVISENQLAGMLERIANRGVKMRIGKAITA